MPTTPAGNRPASSRVHHHETATERPPAVTAVITTCADGPLLVRGDVDLRTPSGEAVPRRRGTVALCRCGASAVKPFCDGSHKAIGFRTADGVSPRLSAASGDDV